MILIFKIDIYTPLYEELIWKLLYSAYPDRFILIKKPLYNAIYEGHPESKECFCVQSAYVLCCSRPLVSGAECDVEKCLMQLYVGLCHVVSAQIAVAMAVPIENPADSFPAGRWDLRLSCRRGKLPRGIVLLHDSARPHTAQQTQALLCEQFLWDIFEHQSRPGPSTFSCF